MMDGLVAVARRRPPSATRPAAGTPAGEWHTSEFISHTSSQAAFGPFIVFHKRDWSLHSSRDAIRLTCHGCHEAAGSGRGGATANGRRGGAKANGLSSARASARTCGAGYGRICAYHRVEYWTLPAYAIRKQDFRGRAM